MRRKNLRFDGINFIISIGLDSGSIGILSGIENIRGIVPI
jgi:hypothetical protein